MDEMVIGVEDWLFATARNSILPSNPTELLTPI